MSKSLNQFFLEIIFPNFCVICEEYGPPLCEKCLKGIPLNKKDVCPICEKRDSYVGSVCGFCQKKKNNFFLDGLLVASFYKNPLLKKAIYNFKYNLVKELSFPLAQILAKKFLKFHPGFKNFVFTSVPLHSKKLFLRGFNQSSLLGNNLQKILEQKGIEVSFTENILQRTKNNSPQMKIKSIKARKENVKNCFGVSSQELPSRMILIDDIITTGATLNECARVLKKNGVKVVWGLVLARQG